VRDDYKPFTRILPHTRTQRPVEKPTARRVSICPDVLWEQDLVITIVHLRGRAPDGWLVAP
jgi:hypothetical protein